MSPRPVRRTQAISPFGVGAMIDFPGPESLIHCGLDSWPISENDHNHEEFKITDELRLAHRLGVDYFVQPPDFRYPSFRQDTNEPNLNLKLPFLRFPMWHVCPRCGRMFKSALHDRSAPFCDGPIASGSGKGQSHRRRKTIQVRFIAACMHGHLQDFPWWEWVYQSSHPIVENRRLRMNTSGSSSLAGVRIDCEENNDAIRVVAKRTLTGAFTYDPGVPSALSRIGVQCQGHNPALGIPSSTQQAPGCGQHLYTLLRGGSNVYFPHVMSSIYIPPVDHSVSEDALEILENPLVRYFFSMLSQGTEVQPEHARMVLQKHYPESNMEPELLAEAANKVLNGMESAPGTRVETDSEEQAYRREEYELFNREIQDGYPKTNLLVRPGNMLEYESVVQDFFSKISFVHKLRETRAFTGFTRIYPENDMSEEDKRKLISRIPKKWLPAIIVRGEGIFLQLREDRVRSWLDEHNEQLQHRIRIIQATLDHVRASRHQNQISISPRFVLIHTMAHLLINQLIYECGYGSASLRERLYCSDGENPMSGVLIYTAAGDSEGTMGGLVRMANSGRLEGVIKRALEKARWCSTDPVCIESSGQGPDNCNLAACHSCALLPETSCEEQNRLLDRGLMIGTLSQSSIGYFNKYQP